MGSEPPPRLSDLLENSPADVADFLVAQAEALSTPEAAARLPVHA